jgi:phosphonoacetaldehyde hydrolase
MDNKIKSVIFDVAGTLIDYGCFAPVNTMIEVFASKGIRLTHKEIRYNMGLSKFDHIKSIFNADAVSKEWMKKTGGLPEDEDVYLMCNEFNSRLKDNLVKYCEVIPGASEIVGNLRKRKIKIGITTGYNKEAMTVLMPLMKEKGIIPDSIVTPDEVPFGRPFPYMCYKNAINLNSYPLGMFVKVGDTLADIEEGLNAGMWTVGVIKGGNELGMSADELCASEINSLNDRTYEIREKFFHTGAHYVIDEIDNLELMIEHINQRIFDGESPGDKFRYSDRYVRKISGGVNDEKN